MVCVHMPAGGAKEVFSDSLMTGPDGVKDATVHQLRAAGVQEDGKLWGKHSCCRQYDSAEGKKDQSVCPI